MQLLKKEIKNDINNSEYPLTTKEIVEGISRAAPIGIGIVKDRKFIFVNDFLCDMLEYSKEELIGNNSRMVYPTDEDYEYVGRIKYQQMKKTNVGTVETRFRTKSGKILNVILSSSYTEKDKPEKGAIFTALDITERKKIEDQLVNTQKNLKTFINGIPESAFLIDTQGIVVEANDTLSKRLGVPKDKMIGVSAYNLLDMETSARRKEYVTRVISSKLPLKIEDVRSGRIIENNLYPILDGNNEVTYVAVIGLDVTERKKSEEIIKQLNDNLKLLNKILRHDISNDLTVVSLSLEMIETKDEELKNKAFNAIKRSVDLIEKIRSLESTMVTRYNLKPVVIGQITELIKKSYSNININLINDCTVMADEALVSVIENIINNSITHGKTNKIDIEVASDEGICQIKIIDYGIGIPEHIKERVFDEEFSYGENKGTGLGLYISKKTIERYGGEIEVKDTKPNGATFVIKLGMTK